VQKKIFFIGSSYDNEEMAEVPASCHMELFLTSFSDFGEPPPLTG
jgi:hypothetical protein